MCATVGANVVEAELYLFAEDTLLERTRRSSRERTVREIHRALQVGVVRTGVYLRRRRVAPMSHQLDSVAVSLRAQVDKLAEASAAAKVAQKDADILEKRAKRARQKEQRAITEQAHSET